MSHSLFSLLLLIPAVMLGISALITAVRLVIGPNSLDRVLSLDGFTALLQCALAVYISCTLDTTVSSAMLVIALLGFISSVSVARFRRKDGAAQS